MSTATASKPVSGFPKVHEAGDYPIILGESLRNDSTSNPRLLRLRYNWEPQNGFSRQKGVLRRSGNQIQLAYKDEKSSSSTYDYKAVDQGGTDAENDGQMTQYALVFDSKKSAYVLEQISQSLDFNLSSAHDQSKDEVRRHQQITAASIPGNSSQSNVTARSEEQDEDDADPNNPFDFRHFLSEAKDNAEKAVQSQGSRTPLHGGHTPMSGLNSPSLAAGRFLSTNTPTFKPIVTSAPVTAKPSPAKPAPSATSKKQPSIKRKPATSKAPKSQPLSSEVISDSSDGEMQNTVTLADSSSSQSNQRGHIRNASSTSMGRSPHIVVSDGGLEIDMGSPPPEPRRQAMLDPGIFRSQTQTPTWGVSSNKPPPRRSYHEMDIDTRNRSDDEDEDHDHDRNRGTDAASDVEMDEDVPQFALGSPRSKRSSHESTREAEQLDKAPSPPTPLPRPPEDDDVDFLERELEMELALGDEGMAPATNAYDDDESEVSEEE